MAILHAVNLFSLFPASPIGGCARSLLIKGTKSCGMMVPGCVLEGQFRTEDGRFVLFITHDAPLEGQLELLLLDRRCRIEEQLPLRKTNTPGALTDLRIANGGEAMEFRFFAGRSARLEVLHDPQMILSPPSLPPGARRPFSWRRSLVLTVDQNAHAA